MSDAKRFTAADLEAAFRDGVKEVCDYFAAYGNTGGGDGSFFWPGSVTHKKAESDE